MVQFLDVDGHPFRFECIETGKTIIHRIDKKTNNLEYLTTAKNIYAAVDFVRDWVTQRNGKNS